MPDRVKRTVRIAGEWAVIRVTGREGGPVRFAVALARFRVDGVLAPAMKIARLARGWDTFILPAWSVGGMERSIARLVPEME